MVSGIFRTILATLTTPTAPAPTLDFLRTGYVSVDFINRKCSSQLRFEDDILMFIEFGKDVRRVPATVFINLRHRVNYFCEKLSLK